MDATLYTGNGSTQSIINSDLGSAGFKPDLVWMKQRTSSPTPTWNLLCDSVRGTGKLLSSNQDNAEINIPQSLTAFNSNGFSLGADPDGSANSGWNYSGASQVAWQWQAGAGTTTTNNVGSVSSQVSVNTTAGFSVVTYTGNGVTGTQTVGHGLNAVPKLVLVKNRSEVFPFTWYYSFKDGSWDYLFLNSTGTGGNADEAAPSSTTFNLAANSGGLPYLNNSGSNYVAYCWAQVDGFSAFGSYVGNNSSDGPFIYTGFRPAFVLIKNYAGGSGQDWLILDTARSPYNVEQARLKPNSPAAEVSGDGYDYIDALSNGFKLRGQSGSNGTNGSGYSYIYMAFAENPFKYANAR